jgi:NTE family protein
VSDGRSQLVDGGVLNPLPINLVRRQSDEIVVAVNINANITTDKLVSNGMNKEKAAYLKMLDALKSQFLKVDNKVEEKIEQFGFFDLMTKSYDMTQDRLTELTIEVYKPDLVIEISREACGVFEFYRANEVIEEGRKAFHKAYEKSSLAVKAPTQV